MIPPISIYRLFLEFQLFCISMETIQPENKEMAFYIIFILTDISYLKLTELLDLLCYNLKRILNFFFFLNVY